MNKKFLTPFISIFSTIVVVYILLVTLIPFEKPAASWWAFVFTLVAIVFCMLTMLHNVATSKTTKSKLYAYPTVKVSLIYAVVQTVASVILFIIGAFVEVPFWVGLAVGVLLLAFALIGFFLTNSAKLLVEQTESETQQNTATMQTIRSRLADVLDVCENSLKKEISDLVTIAKYSDPVSSTATKEIEIEIVSKISELNTMIGSTDNSATLQQITTIKQLLEKRNRVCKQNKQQ